MLNINFENDVLEILREEIFDKIAEKSFSIEDFQQFIKRISRFVRSRISNLFEMFDVQCFDISPNHNFPESIMDLFVNHSE